MTAGRIRLVNPDCGHGLIVLDSALLILSADGGETWELSTFLDGLEYFARGCLDRTGLRAVARGLLGPDPNRWSWTALPARGEPRRLPAFARPSNRKVSRLASAVFPLLQSDPAALPVLDRVEIWLCEPSTGNPIARVSTALSLERALAQTHVPPFQVVPSWQHTPETWAFQQKLNTRLNNAPLHGRYRFQVKLYERTDQGVFRVGRAGVLGRIRPGVLPDTPLAEPWESARLALLNRLDVRAPGRASTDRLPSRVPPPSPPTPRLGAVATPPPPSSAAG